MTTVALKKKLAKIELLIMDVDGVLTNGKINVMSDGNELKMFDVQDGMGIVLFHRAGFKTGIISARANKATDVRAKDLGISKVYQGVHPKTDAYSKMLKELKVKNEKVCFIGDDLTDICMFDKVGVAVSVPNGVGEVKKRVHFITKNRGGEGAVRELIEMILKAKGLWKNIVKELS
ncbi:MAG: 3-deoxy-D-manno-octulosonate 8-phosphate phosphatase (KDO 8-P phosphatase) [Candidatus Omnitrophota bacterium]|jgi:3-deoxy-D-manno-octulosonate 8-phosphate phosphatase (KDO 8-P phosphatase)